MSGMIIDGKEYSRYDYEETLEDTAIEKLTRIVDTWWKDWKGALTIDSCTDFSLLLRAMLENARREGYYAAMYDHVSPYVAEETVIEGENEHVYAYNELRRLVNIL